jgi:DNA-binding MarR family transcriptional regulator
MRAYMALRESVVGVLEEFSLDPRLWSILSTIAEHPQGIRNNEIARQLHVQAPLITMRAKELIDADYILSKKKDEDFRSKYFKLTPKGKVLMGKLNVRLNKRLGLVVKDVTEQDLSTYFMVLEKIIENSEHISNNGNSSK